MNARTIAIAGAALIPFFVGQASAAVITEHFDVTLAANAFTTSVGTPLTAPVSLSFDLTFDPTVVVTDQFSGFAHTASSFPVNSAYGYSVTDSTAGLPNYLFVGGAAFGTGIPSAVAGISIPGNDFYLHIADIAGTPTFQQLGFSNGNSYYFTPTDTITNASTAVGVTFSVSQVLPPSAVPLPGSLPLLGAALCGLAGYGVLRQRGKSRSPNLVG